MTGTYWEGGRPPLPSENMGMYLLINDTFTTFLTRFQQKIDPSILVAYYFPKRMFLWFQAGVLLDPFWKWPELKGHWHTVETLMAKTLVLPLWSFLFGSSNPLRDLFSISNFTKVTSNIKKAILTSFFKCCWPFICLITCPSFTLMSTDSFHAESGTRCRWSRSLLCWISGWLRSQLTIVFLHYNKDMTTMFWHF